MKAKIKQNPYFSIILVLPNRRTTFALRIPKWLIQSTGLVLVAIAGVLSFFFLFSVKTSYQLTDYSTLKSESVKQVRQIERFNSQMNGIKNDLKRLVDKEEQIRVLLGESETNRFARERTIGLFGEKKNR